MPRALQPFTPCQDIEARRRWAGPTIAGVLTEELAEFCQSGVSVVIATSTADGMPIAGRAKACRITPDGRMRIYLPESLNTPLLAAFGRGAPIAVTFSAPRNHRSIQVKAANARPVALAEGDLEEVARQVQLFEDDLVFVNYAPRFSAHYTHYRPEEIVAIEFSPKDAFVQTPGPGAGEHLSP
jgi:hypothetical protein